ncbi:AmmeMemoRadiSam system protein B [Candidatus Sumerlaeota bacterium]|nr:AmmeMemoRadiSam system protein B [Candidatus Sumerlaeota bacterium]
MIWYPDLDRPRLRPIEAIPIEHEGETLIGLHDPSGLAKSGLAVSPPMFFALTLMNGLTSIDQITAAFKQQFDVELPEGTLREFVLQLDEGCLLESMHFRQHREERLAAYRALPARPMTHGGRGYPTDPEEFTEAFNSHFTAEGGPGSPPEPESGPEIRALIAPHIDFERGAINYGWAYQALGSGATPETAVILGTSHQPCRHPLTLTRLGFETPLGTLEPETGFIEALAERLDYDPFEDELIHVMEHSVEFQAVALRHLFPDASEMRIVPILCGSLADDPTEDGVARGDRFERAIGALIETIASWDRRVCVIAGADLAHVGPQFGDEQPVSEEQMAEVASLDREALNLAAAGDAEGFLESFAPTHNARRVCSVACMYTALRCLPSLEVERGRVLHYAQSVHPSQLLAVTHASVAFP